MPRGGNSTKEKPYVELKASSQSMRRTRERRKAEGVPLKKDGTPDLRFKLKPEVAAAHKVEKTAVPSDPEEVEKATAEEKLRELILKNNRAEGVTVLLEDAEKQFINLLETFKAGLHLFPDKFKLHCPDATEDHIQALKKIGDEVVSMIKGAAYDKS